MSEFLTLTIAIFCLMVGSVLGYFARQSIAKRKAGSLEAELQKKLEKAKKESEDIILQAKKEAEEVLDLAKKEEQIKREEIFKIENILRKREVAAQEKLYEAEKIEKTAKAKIEKLKEIKENLEQAKEKIDNELEKISGLKKEDAKKEVFSKIEKEYETEIVERIRKLEKEGEEKFEKRAKEILAQAIQKFALSQAQEITTTTVLLPNEEIKGRIIGKEGRNIRALETLTGTEILIDETPQILMISGFNPIRREVAKIALERLIKDGRIQPAKIEEEVKRAEEEITKKIKEAGEQALFETGILGLDPKLVQILGRLKFRTSYGQNVLQNSIETSILAGALAEELGANVEICKRASLLHDIGKALDHQVQGSHVDIGIKILEKFGESKEVIDAMKSHHGEYPAESLEAVLVQVADQISGARPGARKDTLENYLKRLENLENIALRFNEVEKAYAIQAGRELRVFVKPEKVSDLQAHNIAREIAKNVQEELKYPGEIKVTVVREKRIIEYAK